MVDNGTTLPKGKALLGTLSTGIRMNREAAARAWVKAAGQAGLNPRIVQRSLSSADAGEWHILTDKAGYAPLGEVEVLPGELWDDVFMILEADGKIEHDQELKCWHGAVLLDGTGRRAIALRLRLARRSLNLSTASFYEPIQPDFSQSARERSYSDSELRTLCACHGIPEEWLMAGEPAEIELPG